MMSARQSNVSNVRRRLSLKSDVGPRLSYRPAVTVTPLPRARAGVWFRPVRRPRLTRATTVMFAYVRKRVSTEYTADHRKYHTIRIPRDPERQPSRFRNARRPDRFRG